MRRLPLLALTLALVVLIGTTAATANEHDDHGELPEHPHVLVLGAVLDGPPGPGSSLIGYRKCVDLAANRALPLGSHHHNVHFGTAGQQLFMHAGNLVGPTAPFPGVPWTDCDSLIEFFGLD